MTVATEANIDFTPAMDFTIDKDDFWQLSTATVGAGTPMDGHHQQRDPPGFFDQYVVMDGAEAAHSPGESFFVPLQEGEDGISVPAPASSASERLTSTNAPPPHANTDSVRISCTSQVPTAERSTRSGSLTTSVQQSQCARQAGQIAGTDNRGLNNHVVLGHLNAETIEQRRRLLSGRRGQEQPAGGSISDSELLKLEGLTVKSPRGLMARTGPSSSAFISTSVPPKSSSSADGFLLPPSSIPKHSGVVAPTPDDIDLCNLAKNGQPNFKSAGSRRLESIYATIRRTVGGHSRQRIQSHQQPSQQQPSQQQQPQQQQQQQQPPKTAPIPQTSSPSLMESAERNPRRFLSDSQLMWDGLPISPPLTDMAHPQNNRADASAFVAGLMDDPFFDSHSFHHEAALGHAAQLNGKAAAFNSNIPSTPLHTPNNFKTETATDDPSQYFSATTTGDHWSLAGTSFVNSADLPHSTPFLSDSGIITDGWTFGDPSSDSGSNNLSFGSTADAHSPSTSTRNHNNLTIQVPHYAVVHDNNHSPGSETDHLGPANALMIHMPQPRTPGSAPLLSSGLPHTHPNAAGLADATGAMYTFPGSHESTPQHHHHLPQQQQQQHMAAMRGAYTDHTHRRHKPRAPSSGARYHQHLPMGATNLSPRKVRQPSSSSSSPSPTPHHTALGTGRRSRSASRRQSSISGGLNGMGGSGANHLQHRKSTTDLSQHGGIVVPSSDTNSHAIRKRRSISSWRGSSSGSGGGSSSSSRRNGSGSSSNGDNSTVGGSFGSGSGFGLGGSSGGGAEIGFVNYTPDDHNVLMTGVAPSGSSKTKARREKEAMERQRKLSEAVVKAVTAAGVDVSRLKEEGIVI